MLMAAVARNGGEGQVRTFAVGSGQSAHQMHGVSHREARVRLPRRPGCGSPECRGQVGTQRPPRATPTEEEKVHKLRH